MLKSWLDKRYLHLVAYKTYADLNEEAERTYVGYLWWVLEPLIHMAVFYLVFKVFLGRGGPNYVPFLLIGLVTWKWFQTGVRVSAISILSNAGLMQQVYLPKVIFPTVVIFTFTAKFLLAFTLLLIFLWLYGFSIGWAYLALPLVFCVQLLFICGLAYIVAALVPFLPDLRIVLDNGLTFLFFLSGVFFDGTSLSPQHQFYFRLNPMANLIESYRLILMHGAWPKWQALGLTTLIGMVGIGLGLRLLMRYDRLYPRMTF